MNQLYRNPAAWLSLAIFAALTFFFFRHFPIAASCCYGSIILYFVAKRVLWSWRLRKHGFRVRISGRDDFFYEEIVAGETRGLIICGELQAKGARVIYLPNSDEWRQQMPGWARDRREEILGRVREELGSKHFRYIDTATRILGWTDSEGER